MLFNMANKLAFLNPPNKSSTPQLFLKIGSNCFTYTEVAVTLEIVKFQIGLGLLAPLTSLRQVGRKGVIPDE